MQCLILKIDLFFPIKRTIKEGGELENNDTQKNY